MTKPSRIPRNKVDYSINFWCDGAMQHENAMQRSETESHAWASQMAGWRGVSWRTSQPWVSANAHAELATA